MAELDNVIPITLHEEIANQAENIEKVVRSLTQIKIAFAGIGAAFGVCAGSLIAFKIAYNRAAAKYSELAENEIAEMREHYVAKTEATMNRITKPDLDVVVNKLGYIRSDADVIREQEAIEEVEAQVGQDVVERNIFEEAEIEDVWDYAKEVKNRHPDVPYVIHKDEFTENAPDYGQITLTYYEGDDVLADHRDNVIDDEDAVVCLGSLSKFGHGSGDPNVVYVRNEELEMDYEILHSDGSYGEEVHGFKHSNTSRRTRLEWDG